MVAHAFHPSPWEAGTGRYPEFEASLVYLGSSDQLRLYNETYLKKRRKKRQSWKVFDNLYLKNYLQ